MPTLVEADDEIDDMLRDCGQVGRYPASMAADKTFGLIFEAPGVEPLDVRTVGPTARIATYQWDRLGLVLGAQIQIDTVRVVADEETITTTPYLIRDIEQTDDTGESVLVLESL